jgi:hypothetical protein
MRAGGRLVFGGSRSAPPLLSQAPGMKARYAAALLIGGLATVLGACATRSSRQPSAVGDTALGMGSSASPGEPAGASDGFHPARPRLS